MLLFRNGQQFYFAAREPLTMPETYLSFLVRLWHEPNTEPPMQPTHWKGEVEHIQSGQRWTLETLHVTAHPCEGCEYVRRMLS